MNLPMANVRVLQTTPRATAISQKPFGQREENGLVRAEINNLLEAMRFERWRTPEQYDGKKSSAENTNISAISAMISTERKILKHEVSEQVALGVSKGVAELLKEVSVPDAYTSDFLTLVIGQNDGPKFGFLDERRKYRNLLFTIGHVHGPEKVIPELKSAAGGFETPGRSIQPEKYFEKLELAIVASALGDSEARNFLFSSLKPKTTMPEPVRAWALFAIGEALKLSRARLEFESAEAIEKRMDELSPFLRTRHSALATEAFVKMGKPPTYLIDEFRRGNLLAAPALSKLGERGYNALLEPFKTNERWFNKGLLGKLGDTLTFTFPLTATGTLISLGAIVKPASLAGSLLASASLNPSLTFATLLTLTVATPVYAYMSKRMGNKCEAAMKELAKVSEPAKAREVIAHFENYFTKWWEPAGNPMHNMVMQFFSLFTRLPLYLTHQPSLRAVGVNTVRSNMVALLEKMAQEVPEVKADVLRSLERMHYRLEHPGMEVFGAITGFVIGVPYRNSYAHLRSEISNTLERLR